MSLRSNTRRTLTISRLTVDDTRNTLAEVEDLRRRLDAYGHLIADDHLRAASASLAIFADRLNSHLRALRSTALALSGALD